MSFWRKEVIDFALHRETETHIQEQHQWIAREPNNPRPWYNLAQLYRISARHDEALALLLHAVSLDETCADAHVALAEMYAVRDDYDAARRHARIAEDHGNPRGAEMLARYGLGARQR